MRTAFIDTLCEIAAADTRVWLLCADLGFSVLERFRDRFPERYVNVGVAEQNMTGVAAGLAHSGKIVFTYSIANFPTLRCLEQIRNDVCYHNLSVKVVSVGGGFAYGSMGYTHHGLEDLATLRVLPNLDVVAPADPIETRLATQALWKRSGPGYLRLGKAGEPVVHAQLPALVPGKMIPVRDGQQALLLSTGGMLSESLQAASLAEAEGISVAVWSCPWIKPIDEAALAGAARQFPLILTVEEAMASGGLGGAVAELLAEMPVPRTRLVRCGSPDSILPRAYSQTAARKQLGLDAAGLCQRLLAEMPQRSCHAHA